MERFNRSVSEEVLDAHSFSTISQVGDLSWAGMLSTTKNVPTKAWDILPAEFKRRLLSENSILEL